MRRCSGSIRLACFSFLSVSDPRASAQVDRITIAAGTDEDHALQAITSEQDPQKKLALYEEFVQKFSSNPAAVAYGNWQISQAYQATGDLQKALDYGDKALAGSPHNLDILVSQAGVAQQAKNNAKLMDYAAKGGEVCHSIAKQSKPEGMSDEDFARKVDDEKEAAQNSCDFLETSGFNAITSETDPKTRMADIEKFTAAFPDSKFQDQVSNYALNAAPSQLKDKARLVAYGEKTLAANPNSLAGVAAAGEFLRRRFQARQRRQGDQLFAEVDRGGEARMLPTPTSRGKSPPEWRTTRWDSAYLKQEKTAAAIPELKTAAALLKGQDDAAVCPGSVRSGFRLRQVE